MADNSTKIILTAEDRTAATLAAVKGNLGGVAQSAELANRALAGIGVTFSGAAMVAMIKGTIDAADGFNDLAQRVGIGIKELAGWTLAANQSGTSIESVAKGVKSLSTYMVEHSDKLRAAGITATDANGAMVQLADLFAGMPDGVEKTALAVQLFGKAGMDMIPMLNQGSAGLAEAQEKAAEYGRRMAELAPDADKFNDQVAEMALNMKALGINVTSYVIDPLNNMAKALNDLAAGGARARAQLDFLAENGHPIARSMQAWSGVLGRMGFGETRSRGYTGPKDAAGLPMSEEAMFSGATDAYMAQREAGQRARGLLDKSSAAGGGGAAKYRRSFDPEADFFYAVEEAQRKATRAQMDANDKKLDADIAKYKEFADPLQKYRVELDRIEELKAAGLISTEQAVEATWSVGEQMDKAAEKAFGFGTRAEKAMDGMSDAARELGMTFSSAFEDAIIGGRGLQSILQGLAQDVARLMIRKQFTEPMAAGLSSFFGGSSLLGSLFGGGGSSGGGFDWMPTPELSFAGGGYTGNGARAGGMDGQGGFLAMLHPQETVIDHAAGQSGGHSFNFQIDARGAEIGVEQRIAGAVKQAVSLAVAAVQGQADRGGSYARALGRRA